MYQKSYSQYLSILYFLFVFIDVIGIVTDLHILRYIFKPMLMPVLALAYITSVTSIQKSFIIALFFSFLGDVFLLFEGGNYFILGLASFLTTHIIYIGIVAREIRNLNSKWLLFAVTPFLIFYFTLMYLISPNLAEMKLPVIIYGIVISIFGVFTLYYYYQTRSKKVLLLLLGACIFIASDTCIALQKFYLQNIELGSVIMLTYTIAQFLIYKYMIKKVEAI